MLRKRHYEDGYRPELDGLRGLAVGSVVLHHADPNVLSGGYVGVDVFFVISGYLITSKLAKDLDEGTFSFANFYARRIKRLLPAALVLGIAALAIGALMLLPRDFKNLGATTAAYMAMAANFAFWARDGYFEAQGRQWPLLHTWSLAVEEQFYLLYPAILLCFTQMRMRLLGLWTLVALSFGWNLFRTLDHGQDSYYLLPSRAWELLLGGVVALSGNAQRGHMLASSIGLVGLSMILVPMRMFDHATAFPGWHALLPVGGAAAVIWAMSAQCAVCKRILTLHPLVALGKLSYSIYLWHWPLIIYAKYPWSAAPQSTPRSASWAACALSLPLAWMTYRFIEMPGRRSRLRDDYTLFVGAFASALLAILGGAIWWLDGVPSRIPARARDFASVMNARHERQAEAMGLTAEEVREGQVVRLGSHHRTAEKTFILWGDSHANALIPLVDELAEEYGLSGLSFCRAGTPPVLDTQFKSADGGFIDHDFIEAVYETILADPPDDVILAANWVGLVNTKVTITAGGQSVSTPEEKAELLAASLLKTVERLKNSGVGRVWLVRSVPTQPFNVPRQCAMNIVYGRELPVGLTESQFNAAAAMADRMLAVCAAFPGVRVLDLPHAIFAVSDGMLTRDGRSLYIDNNHLSVDGASAGRNAIEPAFRAMSVVPN